MPGWDLKKVLIPANKEVFGMTEVAVREAARK